LEVMSIFAREEMRACLSFLGNLRPEPSARIGIVLCFVSLLASGCGPTLWDARIEAGMGAYRQGRYAEAEKSWRAALEEAETSGRRDARRLARSLNNLGWLYGQQGRLDEAEEFLTRARAVADPALSTTDRPGLAAILDNLGRLYHLQRRYAEA